MRRSYLYWICSDRSSSQLLGAAVRTRDATSGILLRHERGREGDLARDGLPFQDPVRGFDRLLTTGRVDERRSQAAGEDLLHAPLGPGKCVDPDELHLR